MGRQAVTDIPPEVANSPLRTELAVDELFTTDPVGLPDADFARLVSNIRARRNEIAAAEAAKAAAGKTKRAKEPTKPAAQAAIIDTKPTAKLSLDDLM
jgi:hypothetical protein